VRTLSNVYVYVYKYVYKYILFPFTVEIKKKKLKKIEIVDSALSLSAFSMLALLVLYRTFKKMGCERYTYTYIHMPNPSPEEMHLASSPKKNPHLKKKIKKKNPPRHHPFCLREPAAMGGSVMIRDVCFIRGRLRLPAVVSCTKEYYCRSSSSSSSSSSTTSIITTTNY
jgi:hypothetical protein